MKIEEMQKNIRLHPIWQKDIPFGFQPGLPMLSVEQNKLCVSFFIHRAVSYPSKFEMFPPEYFATWVYPFKKMVRFFHLPFHSADPLSVKPVAFDLNDLAIQSYNGIYDECENAILSWLNENASRAVYRYQEYFDSAVGRLGLGSMYDRGKINVLYGGF